MKKIIIGFSIVLFLSSFSNCKKDKSITLKQGCRDRNALNYDASAQADCNGCCNYPAQGALLFWTNNPNLLLSCGVVTIKLSNGMQANITGYYFAAPANCINQFGGYLYLPEGTYTYQVITNGCNVPGGSATVIGNRCNMARIN